MMHHRHYGTSFEISQRFAFPRKVGRCKQGKVTAYGLRRNLRLLQQARVCYDPCGLDVSLTPVTRDVTLV
jgi:hypothetical protein